jgi:hypothetical protein
VRFGADERGCGVRADGQGSEEAQERPHRNRNRDDLHGSGEQADQSDVHVLATGQLLFGWSTLARQWQVAGGSLGAQLPHLVPRFEGAGGAYVAGKPGQHERGADGDESMSAST